MNDNGRKPSSKQSSDERPWWHSGTKCVAMSTWMFTLAVAWRITFSYSGWTGSSAVLLGFSLVLSVVMGCVVLGSENRR